MAGPSKGFVIIQSGQPYSVIDYSGAVGSIFYSIYDGITNPIVPLNTAIPGLHAAERSHGAKWCHSGFPALNPACFTVPAALSRRLNCGRQFPTG